ncbi:right-handed parallel beta-helix repeat-containing protein [Microbacterium soli]|uniref:Right handed beta helix domain-containing protein n=1 Tax=Microbacterium soli TaxID=446075 RepID=A0ABP7N6A7_9MICO
MSLRKHARGAAITAVTILTAAASVTFGLSSAAMAADDATTYYIDCSAEGDGNGSEASPFTSLDQINAIMLTAGDRALFRRGATCNGEFAPQGGGSQAAPVVIADYGDAATRAVIDADGAENGVLLKNNSFLHLTDLEVVAPGDNIQKRRGVAITGEDGGALKGIRVEGMYIHDVRGTLPAVADPGSVGSFKGKTDTATGGIIVDAEGDKTPTWFEGLQILNNRIEDVDRQGIYFWSNWCQRPMLNRWGNFCDQPWAPSTDVLVAGNELRSIGGDGLVLHNVDGGVVEHNTLDGFNRRSKSNNAGLWTANADNVTFQYNRVMNGLSTYDTQAFDIDHATNDITIRYNFSRDNEGGFLLLCPDNSGTINARVHDNISVNEGARVVQNGCGGPVKDAQIYNNTIYSDSTAQQFWLGSGTNATVDVFNNLIVAEGEGRITYGVPTGVNVHDNLFQGVDIGDAESDNIVTDDAALSDPRSYEPDGYRLLSDSPAIGAGIPRPEEGTTDFFDTPAPGGDAEPVNIGAYQGDGFPAPDSVECTARLRAEGGTVVDGIAAFTLTSTNPCAHDVPGGPVTVSVSPDFEIVGVPGLPEVPSGESAKTEVRIAVPAETASGRYPVAFSQDGVRPVTGVITVPQRYSEIAAEDFDDVIEGDVPVGWTRTDANGSGVADLDGDRSLRIERIESTTNVARWDFGEDESPDRVAFAVRAAQTDSALGVHLLDADGGAVARISLADIGVWSYSDNAYFTDTDESYAADTWYDVVIERSGDRFTVAVDGELLGTGAVGSVKPIAALRVQVPSSARNDGSFAVDDIVLEQESEGGLVPADPKPADTVKTEPVEREAADAGESASEGPSIVPQRPAVVEAGNSAAFEVRGFRANEPVTVTVGESSGTAYTDESGRTVVAVPLGERTVISDAEVRAEQDRLGDGILVGWPSDTDEEQNGGGSSPSGQPTASVGADDGAPAATVSFGSDELAETGQELPWAPVGAAVILLALAAGLMVRRRRLH